MCKQNEGSLGRTAALCQIRCARPPCGEPHTALLAGWRGICLAAACAVVTSVAWAAAAAALSCCTDAAAVDVAEHVHITAGQACGLVVGQAQGAAGLAPVKGALARDSCKRALRWDGRGRWGLWLGRWRGSGCRATAWGGAGGAWDWGFGVVQPCRSTQQAGQVSSWWDITCAAVQPTGVHGGCCRHCCHGFS